MAARYLRAVVEYLKKVDPKRWRAQLLAEGFDPKNPLHAHLFDVNNLVRELEAKMLRLRDVPVEHIKESATIHPVTGIEPVQHDSSIGRLLYRKNGDVWESPLPLLEDVAHVWTRGGYLKVKITERGVDVKPRRVDNFNALTVSRVHGVVFPHPERGIVYVHLGKNRYEIRK